MEILLVIIGAVVFLGMGYVTRMLTEHKDTSSAKYLYGLKRGDYVMLTTKDGFPIGDGRTDWFMVTQAPSAGMLHLSRTEENVSYLP